MSTGAVGDRWAHRIQPVPDDIEDAGRLAADIGEVLGARAPSRSG